VRLSEDGYIRAIPVDSKIGGQPGPYIALRAALLQPDDIVFVPENNRSQVGRFIDDIINRPFSGVNSILGTYVNFRVIESTLK
jgi:hypothetical protein